MSASKLLPTVMGAVIVILIASCGDDPVSSYEPEVVNQLDNFHFTMEDVSEHDTSLTYYWRTDGTSANINQQASIRGGRSTMRIVDLDSTETYLTDFTQNGDFQSGSGRTGTWKITIRLFNFSGMIDFRVQRR